MTGTSAEAVEGLLTVCFPDARTICDPTYGQGHFWRGSVRQVFAGDACPDRARDCRLDFRALPFGDGSVDVLIYDPPLQPQTSRVVPGERERRFTHMGNGVDQLRAIMTEGLHECRRVARLGLIVKVQDYIHSHRPVWMSLWVWDALGTPYDFLTLRQQTPKMRASNWKGQRSVWRNHSTFWVYRVRGRR